jgi:hypothetical protein
MLELDAQDPLGVAQAEGYSILQRYERPLLDMLLEKLPEINLAGSQGEVDYASILLATAKVYRLMGKYD